MALTISFTVFLQLDLNFFALTLLYIYVHKIFRGILFDLIDKIHTILVTF